jgi:hypothetical protein
MLVIFCCKAVAVDYRGQALETKSLSMRSLPETMCRMDTVRTIVASDKESETTEERQVEGFQEQGSYIEDMV